MLLEERDDFFILLIFRIRQGRVAVFVLAVDISSSAIRQQQPNDVYVPIV